MSLHAAWRFLREVFGPIVFRWQPWRGRKVAVPIGKPLIWRGRAGGRQTKGWRRGRNALSHPGAFLGKHQSHSLDRERLAQDENSRHSWYNMVRQETQTKATVSPDDILVFHPRADLPADSQTFLADSQMLESDQEDSEEETAASLHGDKAEETAASQSQSPSVSGQFDPRHAISTTEVGFDGRIA